jgi:WXG100 family type VII secretion target
MQIRITPEEMEQVASKFQSNADQTSQIIQSLNSTMEGLVQNWEGVTRNSFYAEFQQQKKSMDDFVLLLQQIHTDLMTIAGNFRTADQQFS